MALIPTVVAQGQSTFTTGNKHHDVLFAVTIPDASTSPDDIYFYIEGPSYSSWIGEGVDRPPMIVSNRGGRTWVREEHEGCFDADCVYGRQEQKWYG